MEFVTRRVTNAVARIKSGRQSSLTVGNLSALRDWGYAPEYVEAARKVLAHDQPSEFVIATGVSTSVREFVQMAFRAADIEIQFSGEGLDEKGFEISSGRVIVSVDEQLFRAMEEYPLVGDASKARKVLGWAPTTPVKELVRLMVESDIYRSRGTN